MTNDLASVTDVVRLWKRLVGEWQERSRSARGPIEAVLIDGTLPPALHRATFYLAHLAKQREVNAHDLLRFMRRPDADARLDDALATVDEIALAAPIESEKPLLPDAQITLDEAAKRAPGGRGRTTLWRWCIQGVNGVYLEHSVFGETIYVTTQAIERFGRQCAEAGRSKVVESGQKFAGQERVSVTPRRRNRSVEEARRVLEAAGIRDAENK